MANAIPTTPQTGGLNYEDYQTRIQKAAAATRATGAVTPDMTAARQAATKIGRTGAITTGPAYARKTEYPYAALGDVAKTAISGYEQQAAGQKKQAEKAASALEMVGETTLQGMRGIERIQEQVQVGAQKASETWGAAAEKADEYVKASRSRVGEVLTKLDEINEDFAKERSFAKAHAMQASVQAVMGSMRAEERNITETYGVASPEYNQFRSSKMNALATVQSNIHTSYQQLAEQQKNTYMNVVNEAYTKSNMYVGFQEQQHVEMVKYSEGAKASYTLQVAQMDATFEQMKMAGMENLANWILETPSFTMDMTPLMTMLADLQMTAQTQAQAAPMIKAQTALTSAEAQKAQTLADWNAGVLSHSPRRAGYTGIR